MKRNEFTPLFCDLYHLTMAQAMFNEGTHNRQETYEMYIRKAPFEGSYLITAGLGEVVQWLDKWKFEPEHLDYLRSIEEPKFSEDFLKMLKDTKLNISMEAMPEGEVVFPNQPIVRVTGPAWQAMIVEAGVLNLINSQSLIATKASRICMAAQSDKHKRRVLELGLRRAQDTQGFSATRAAFIGGVDATSNVEAGFHYNIPVAGTMAHCFIMRELDEVDAFKSYMKTFPKSASVLVDTYDTLEGTKNAIKAAKELDIPLQSVRLDSGDLGYLSKEVRKLLDENNCKTTKIVVSNDLDEYTIKSLIQEQNAPIDVFGVGTMLVTAYDQPALGGVYKLKQTGERPVIKLSENPIKTTIPGATDVVRILDDKGMYKGDIICDRDANLVKDGKLTRGVISVNLANQYMKVFEEGTKAYKPLVAAIINGKVNPKVRDRDIKDIREQTLKSLSCLDASHLRLKSPHIYVAGVDHKLYEKRQTLKANMMDIVNLKRGRE